MKRLLDRDGFLLNPEALNILAGMHNGAGGRLMLNLHPSGSAVRKYEGGLTPGDKVRTLALESDV